MPIKKIGFFRKLLGKIGKHYYWWRAKKLSNLIMAGDYLAMMIALTEFHDGDFQKALETGLEMGKAIGKKVLYEFIDAGKRLFSENLKDYAFLLEVAFYINLGENFKDIEFIPADFKNPAKIVCRLEHCPFCFGVEEDEDLKIDEENFKDLNWGVFVAGCFESAFNGILEYVEADYFCIARETKCLLKGDPFPEYTLYFYPKEEKNESG
ncbi:MAG: hypothetical protein ACFFD2_29815 [Promethearchaeota archaeon]